MKRLLLAIAATTLALSACQKPAEEPFDWDKFNKEQEEKEKDKDKDKPEEKGPLEDPVYRISAHRGGSTESKTPDNSIASLSYAISIGCASSECDIYWTKDDQVVVAHADGECKINGKHPWEATLAELKAGNKLSNGETLPSLFETLEYLKANSKCTKLVLDIKNITVPSTLTQYPINACRRACEIIRECKAQDYVQFICTGNATVMAQSFVIASSAGIPIAWMANQAPSVYRTNCYPWANISTQYIYMNGKAVDEGKIDDFVKAGIEISVYNADSDADMDFYIKHYDKLKYISTNYPAKLQARLKAAGK